MKVMIHMKTLRKNIKHVYGDHTEVSPN